MKLGRIAVAWLLSLGSAAACTVSGLTGGPVPGEDAGDAEAGTPPALDATTDAPPDPSDAGCDGAACSQEYFIAPQGSNLDPGTRDRPWKTFAAAIPQLHPGDTLVLLDGAYDPAGTGTIDADCSPGGNATSGSPATPITLRADHERRADIFTRGDKAAIRLKGCSSWAVDGISVHSDDVPDLAVTAPALVALEGVHDVAVRRMLARKPNRTFAEDVFAVDADSADVLFEECEAYDYHARAFVVHADHTVVRRCYAGSRDRADVDLDGGYTTLDPVRGDVGFDLRDVTDAIVENCISERNRTGFLAGSALHAGQPVRLLGIASVHDVFGVRADATGAPNFNRVTLEEAVVLFASTNGVTAAAAAGAPIRLDITGLSLFGNANGLTAAGVASQVVAARMLVNLNSTGIALVAGASNLVADTSDIFGNAANGTTDPPEDSAGMFRNSPAFAAPTLMGPSGCYAYVPAQSNMKNAVATGDIGANLVNRYERGVLGATKLWSTAGRFPCGEEVAGVNDANDSVESCATVNVRIRIGVSGCPSP